MAWNEFFITVVTQFSCNSLDANLLTGIEVGDLDNNGWEEEVLGMDVCWLARYVLCWYGFLWNLRISMYLSSCNFARSIAGIRLIGWTTWTSRRICAFNREIKQRERKWWGKPVTWFESVSNWHWYSQTVEVCINLNKAPSGSSNWGGANLIFKEFKIFC